MNVRCQVYDLFSCLLFIRFIDRTNWEKFARADYRVGNTSTERPVSLGSFPLARDTRAEVYLLMRRNGAA